jgi:dolichyl-phosphate beta-glucosyltransferase
MLWMRAVIVVIPCYNEAERLREDDVLLLLEDQTTSVLLVDDGSRDATAELLARICARAPDRARFFSLEKNSGKAEAVRQGMVRALELGDPIVGYLDADFATPADEAWRLRDEMEARDALVVMGSRVALLGTHIDRRPARHYLGRVYATLASIVLEEMVYDTQCGAKLFRDVPALRLALSQPFSSRWSFDVELLGRLLAGGDGVAPITRDRIVEVPLRTWIDVDGSKLHASGALKAGLELIRLGARVRLGGKQAFFRQRK